MKIVAENGDDEDARRDAEPSKRRAAARDGVEQAPDERRRLRGRRFDRRPVRSRASFLGLRHAYFLLRTPPPIGRRRFGRKQAEGAALADSTVDRFSSRTGRPPRRASQRLQPSARRRDGALFAGLRGADKPTSRLRRRACSARGRSIARLVADDTRRRRLRDRVFEHVARREQALGADESRPAGRSRSWRGENS